MISPSALRKTACFFKSFHKTRFRKEEILIRAGQPPRGVFYLEKGLVRQYAISEKKGNIINLKLTHKDLASQAGLSRETVSREMKKLEKRDLISYRQNLINIKNLKLFEEEFFGLS